MRHANRAASVRRGKQLRLALAVVLGVVPAGACELPCTKKGCGDPGASFEFDRPETAWEEEQGTEYAFFVTTDTLDLQCIVTLGESPSCDEGLGFIDYRRTGSEDVHVLEALVLDTYPGPTQVVVERDGAVVFEGEFEITALESFPNGERCGDACLSWSTGVTW